VVRRGEVYWCDLGDKEGSAQSGSRPVLIVQNDRGNASSPTTIVAAITSQTKKDYPFHVKFIGSDCGLDKDGIILLEQLQTIDKSELGVLVGTMPLQRMAEVDRALRYSLGLP